MFTNEMNWLGRGVETYNLDSSWITSLGKQHFHRLRVFRPSGLKTLNSSVPDHSIQARFRDRPVGVLDCIVMCSKNIMDKAILVLVHRKPRSFDDLFRRGELDPCLCKRSAAKTGQAAPETSNP